MTTPAIQENILKALIDHFDTLTLSPVLTVAYPGIAFTPPATGMWIELAWIPNTADEPWLDNDAQVVERGIFQIGICDRLGVGEFPLNRAADAVIEHFRKGTKMVSGPVTVRIEQRASSEPAISYDTKIMTPISVRYLCIAPGIPAA